MKTQTKPRISFSLFSLEDPDLYVWGIRQGCLRRFAAQHQISWRRIKKDLMMGRVESIGLYAVYRP